MSIHVCRPLERADQCPRDEAAIQRNCHERPVPGQQADLGQTPDLHEFIRHAAQGLAHFYKVPLERMLVAHDDLDLPFGAIRLRPGGGPGGQKGVASAIERLGTQDFARLRFGIGRPPGRMDPADYVLQDFSSAQAEILGETLDRAVEAALTFVVEGLDRAMNKYNAEPRHE